MQEHSSYKEYELEGGLNYAGRSFLRKPRAGLELSGRALPWRVRSPGCKQHCKGRREVKGREEEGRDKEERREGEEEGRGEEGEGEGEGQGRAGVLKHLEYNPDPQVKGAVTCPSNHGPAWAIAQNLLASRQHLLRPREKGKP